MTLLVDPRYPSASSATPGAPMEVGDNLLFTSGDLTPTVGSPVGGVVARTPVWLFDPTVTEIAALTAYVPTYWNTLHIDIQWCTTSGTGGVVWRADLGGLADNTAAPDPASGTQVTATAAVAQTIYRTRLATGVAAPDGPTAIEIIRLGGDAADTLAVDAGLIDILLTRAS